MVKKLVSFVVLNWNGLDDTLLCIESIRNQTIGNHEIIVVDNGSSTDQKEVLRNIADIKLIDLPANLGFTGGQIAAFNESIGEFIALINNDAVIAPEWAEEALRSFQKNPQLAAIGGKAYLWNEAKGYPAFSLDNPFYSYQVVNLISGHTRTLTYGEKEVNVNSISGSGVMVSRAAIDAVGYFDDRFFAYYEETDLFARFKRAGLEVRYNPLVHTWHKIAQSTRSKPDFYLYQMHRNRYWFAIKNYDAKYAYAFVKFYFREWVSALFSVAKNGAKNRIEEKNLLKAGLWNALHLMPILLRRRRTLSYGATYSQTLLKDAGETISIVIPCYNYAEYVTEAIESALKQSYPAMEIIVINDGSTDHSLAKINVYRDKIQIIDQENHGVIATKNRGLSVAKGDWIVFLDADDKLHKDYLSELYKESRLKNAAIVYSAMRFIGHETGIFWSRPFSRRSLRKGNYINNSALMRRSLVESVGGYKQEMGFGYEDWELYLSLAEKNAKFSYLRSSLLYYRRHPENSRDKMAATKIDNTHILVRKLHPRLFSPKYEIIDFFQGILLFGRNRTPLQIVKDSRYIIVAKLDKLSSGLPLLNKLLGLGRLLSSGDFGGITRKLKLNVGRVWKKIAH